MNFLDFLNAGVTETTRSVGVRDQAKKAALLEALEAESAQETRDLNRRNIESQIADRERGRYTSFAPTGQILNTETGELGGDVTRSPTGTRIPRIDPNSLEGIRAAAERARGVASARADVAAGAPGASARPTADQEKSMMFSRFINEALPTIESLEGKVSLDQISSAFSPVVAIGERLGGPGSITGRVLGDQEQLLVNAARNFTAGVLRKESGAAIGADELRETFQRFIPLAGDSPATIAQKRANRTAMQATMNDLALPAEQYTARVRQFYGPRATVGTTSTRTPQAPTPAQPPVSSGLSAAMQEFSRQQRGRP